jgi:hypothetical protein
MPPADAHALNVAVGHHLLDRLLEHAAKRHALLEALGDHVGHNSGVALGERISSMSSLISGTELFLLQKVLQSCCAALVEPSPERPMIMPGREVLMMTRSLFCVARSISRPPTYMPRSSLQKLAQQDVGLEVLLVLQGPRQTSDDASHAGCRADVQMDGLL